MAKTPENENPKLRKIDSPTPPPRMTEIPGGTTGRYLVLMREDAIDEGVKMLRKNTGRSIASATETLNLTPADASRVTGESMFFENLGVAVVDSPPEQMQAMAAEIGTQASPIIHIEPERYVYALATAPTLVPIPAEKETPVTGLPAATAPLDYLIGYRDAVDHLVDRVVNRTGVAEETLAGVTVSGQWNESQFTWGLQATLVHQCKYSGKGIRVAILDTGLDLGHPDFAGRNITHQSFVPGQTVQDGHGHGTHTAGTACGSRTPGRLPRYGVAYNSDIFIGKVLSNQGSGTDGQILAGIEWAMRNKCAVISMSLGAPCQPGQPPSKVYEQVAYRVLNAGTLIVAAAGNESQRPQSIRPVDHPANCQSIMAVAALDQKLQVAFFSNGGVNPSGGNVDIAAPGVAVKSSWPRPTLYNTLQGTSMATPHVAGIAALFAEMHPNARGLALWALVTQYARNLTLPSRDVGEGITQAP
jgi:subtilisin family serine protease